MCICNKKEDSSLYKSESKQNSDNYPHSRGAGPNKSQSPV